MSWRYYKKKNTDLIYRIGKYGVELYDEDSNTWCKSMFLKLTIYSSCIEIPKEEVFLEVL